LLHKPCRVRFRREEPAILPNDDHEFNCGCAPDGSGLYAQKYR
jgi:hypothetical protein